MCINNKILYPVKWNNKRLLQLHLWASARRPYLPLTFHSGYGISLNRTEWGCSTKKLWHHKAEGDPPAKPHACRRQHPNLWDNRCQNFSSLANILSHFGSSAGLRLKLDKSKLYVCSKSQVIEDWCLSWNIGLGTLPTKYLGIPLMQKRLNKAIFQPLVDKFKAKNKDWTSRLLSKAGHFYLVKSILQSPSLHWLQVFLYQSQ